MQAKVKVKKPEVEYDYPSNYPVGSVLKYMNVQEEENFVTVLSANTLFCWKYNIVESSKSYRDVWQLVPPGTILEVTI